jgi:hypothetical protein
MNEGIIPLVLPYIRGDCGAAAIANKLAATN